MSAEPLESEPDVERWLPVVGYEGLYEVSSWGRVRNPRTRRGVTGRILRTPPDQNGYPRVGLYKVGGRSQTAALVHILVAAAFIGPRPPKYDIRHLDSNSSNPHVSNLAYGTRAENIRDSVLAGTHAGMRKTECVAGHPFDEVNTFFVKNSNRRKCLICHRRRVRASHAKKRAAIKALRQSR